MANRHSIQAAHSVTAVGYIRRSTSKQEKSLTEQQQEIERYAASKGYRILRWYEDDGISGDATERRKGFQQLHSAATSRKDFDLILAWDSDRIGRFDSLEMGYWIHPLRRAGVKLETVTEGPINWDDFAGRLMGAIKQEGKHQYLRDLSRNVSRGLMANAAAGHSCGQAAPYGYDRILLDEAGQERARLKNGDKYAKPRGWRVKLAPSDDAIQVQTVRWLFQTYATTDTGYRAMAAELNRRQIPSATGGKWFDSSVRELLKNSVYLGTFSWNKRRMGKYHRVIAGNIVERDRGEVQLMPCGKPNARYNPPELWTTKENAHEPLVDRQTWEAVQAKLSRRKRSNPGIGYQTHTNRKDRQPYLLSGLLVCQQCGKPMHGHTTKRDKNGRQYSYRKYICSSYTRGDRSCGHYAINQDAIMAALLRKIRQELLLGSLDNLKASLRSQLQSSGQAKDETPQIKRRLAELDKQISLGASRVLTAPEELLEILTTQLQAMKREREQLQQHLQQLRLATRPADIEAEVDRLARKAWTLLDELQQPDSARVRELLHQAVDRVELAFTETQQGKRRIYQAIGGKVVFRELSGCANRGEWSCAQPDNQREAALSAADLAAA